MANSKRDKNNWVKAFQECAELTSRLPKGDGWKTFLELQDEHQMGQNKLRRLIAEGMDNGTFEHFEGTKANGTGRICRSVWYRPK